MRFIVNVYSRMIIGGGSRAPMRTEMVLDAIDRWPHWSTPAVALELGHGAPRRSKP